MIRAGSNGNDVLDLSGKGSSAIDLTVGSISLDLDDPRIVGAVVLGGAGNDTITASRGAGIIFGGTGNDTIIAKVGFDILQGGPGDDIFVFTILVMRELLSQILAGVILSGNLVILEETKFLVVPIVRPEILFFLVLLPLRVPVKTLSSQCQAVLESQWQA